jgi:hypothetical protein
MPIASLKYGERRVNGRGGGAETTFVRSTTMTGEILSTCGGRTTIAEQVKHKEEEE